MQITVKKAWTGVLTLEVEPSTTILEIKEMIAKMENLAPRNQVLGFDKKPLEDSKTVSDYDIQDGATIHLYVGMKGG